ncbi:type IX secretion system protein PorQ [Fulvivirgaceae bacterium BMA10]|uniref:Type IX secretion system protein PorQ n=1 Tax=Splendidivirga corallicola TaxID=3051826 RepID=A0ABT8KJD1_9BACT|nr:type IX secretion system protein PorQ [Fulvivirgaceae bacterium BMA10]
MLPRTSLFAVLLVSSILAEAQVGGRKSFEFLNLAGNAKVAALGGVNISSGNSDVNMFLSNPALIDSTMDQHVSLSYLSFLGGINYSNLTYGYYSEKYGNWAFGLQYLDYGSIESYDESGVGLGSFDSNEFSFNIGHSRNAGSFTIGGNLKFALSNIAGNKASVVLVDLGGAFIHPEKDFVISLLFKNLGLIIRDYTELSDSELPADIQLGASFKPEHMPFRFSITAQNVLRGELAFFNPSSNTDDSNEQPGTVDEIFRHFVFATEFIPSKNFNIRLGYNHLIRRELRLEQLSGGAGFTMGLMFRIKAFEFAYTKAFYHVAGSSNHLTLTSNLKKLLKRTN